MSPQNACDADVRQSSKSSFGSRFNALKHGLTAKTLVLPGECQEEYQAKIDLFKECLGTQDALEDELAEMAGQAAWKIKRSERALDARARRELLNKQDADTLQAKINAAAIGKRLFFDRRGPIELYPSHDFEHKQPRTSCPDGPDDPDDPKQLVIRLEAFPIGCRWLLDRWTELGQILELGMSWQPHEKLKAIRLLGMQPLNAVNDRDVAQVFLACHALDPQFRCAFQELRCETKEDRFKTLKVQLDRWPRLGLVPADATAARAVLLGIVQKATERLRRLEAEYENGDEFKDKLETTIAAHDESKAGEQARRHQASCNRLVHQNLEAIRKYRRDQANGWGRTRQERERRAARGRRAEDGGWRMRRSQDMGYKLGSGHRWCAVTLGWRGCACHNSFEDSIAPCGTRAINPPASPIQSTTRRRTLNRASWLFLSQLVRTDDPRRTPIARSYGNRERLARGPGGGNQRPWSSHDATKHPARRLQLRPFPQLPGAFAKLTVVRSSSPSGRRQNHTVYRFSFSGSRPTSRPAIACDINTSSFVIFTIPLAFTFRT